MHSPQSVEIVTFSGGFHDETCSAEADSARHAAGAAALCLRRAAPGCAARGGVGCTARGHAVPADVLAAQPWRQTDAYSPLPERASLVLVKGGQENASLMPEGESIEDNRALQYIEDTLNVDISFAWIVPSDSFSDKLNLSIASGDIPDVMTVDAIQLQQLAEAGAIEDLTGIVEQYANADLLENWNQTGGVALAAATIDGKVMGIPNVQPQADAPIMVWVRQDWLDKLGLAGPETVDDVEAIAKAFMEQDPDGNGAADTYGLTGTMNPVMVPGNLHGFDTIFNVYGAFPEIFFRNDAGEIVYGSLQPETKEALARLAALYQAGVIDPEFATKTTDNSNEIVVGGKGRHHDGTVVGAVVAAGRFGQPRPERQLAALHAQGQGRRLHFRDGRLHLQLCRRQEGLRTS
jgi:putative aldouronate transport system substrate-binding protein